MLSKKQDLCYLKVTAVQYNDKMFHNYVPREGDGLTFKKGSLIESEAVLLHYTHWNRIVQGAFQPFH